MGILKVAQFIQTKKCPSLSQPPILILPHQTVFCSMCPTRAHLLAPFPYYSFTSTFLYIFFSFWFCTKAKGGTTHTHHSPNKKEICCILPHRFAFRQQEHTNNRTMPILHGINYSLHTHTHIQNERKRVRGNLLRIFITKHLQFHMNKWKNVKK